MSDGVPQGSALAREVLGTVGTVSHDDIKCILITFSEVMLGGIAAFWKGEAEL